MNIEMSAKSAVNKVNPWQKRSIYKRAILPLREYCNFGIDPNLLVVDFELASINAYTYHF